MNEAVRAFHDAGYQVALHTGGDAAVDMALDAIKLAMNANPRPNPRHRIEHLPLLKHRQSPTAREGPGRGNLHTTHADPGICRRGKPDLGRGAHAAHGARAPG